ncbi:CocE/NonD family hydrolase [Kitasatospora nipponensis]|uniref:CocE/NonD family hydrolase n=1 Tax=Kitasatospora nipponensis TaxID=258049 RepID=A0ABN1W737_9ACTN
MRHPSSLPHRTVREDLRLPLADGTTLAARLWRPVSGPPVPALLEYLPDRLSDWTAARDAERHPWYAGHGYASVRVDLRGHGNSDGLPGEAHGEQYGERESADGVEVVRWLAEQPWCSGRVGLFGIGPGATGALRIAALAPEPLAAVVAVCPSDDRYGNEASYLGGSVLGCDLPAGSAARLAAAARPPDPRYVGDDWRLMWLERLGSLEPPVHTWLAHQSRDAYWRRGDLGEDYAAIRAAVLAVGGWAEPSRDCVLRLVEHLTAPVRGLIGPWAHQYPDRERGPGPAIGFLQETLRWWDQWLKGEERGVLDEPGLRSWMPGPAPSPAGSPQRAAPTGGDAAPAGRWIGEDGWPSDDVREIHYGLADTLRTAGTPEGERFVPVRTPQQTGVEAGRPPPPRRPRRLPPRPRAEDGRSVCFDSAPLAERTEILGRPSLVVRLRCAADRGHLVVRLCDVAPDGSSALVTRGVLSLAARRGPERMTPWEPGAVEDVEVELAAIAHAFVPGHRIRLALSSTYWPWLWPLPETAGFGVDPGHSTLMLPVRHLAADVGRAPITFAEPEQGAPLEVHVAPREDGRPEQQLTLDLGGGEWRLAVCPDRGASRSYPDGLVTTERLEETYRIRRGDPLSASAHCERSVRLQRPDQGWDVTVTTGSELGCDGSDFVARDRLTAWEGGAVLFERDWERRIPRTTG